MGSTHSNLLFHLVFRTKGSLPLIDDQLKSELYPYIGGIVKGENADLLALGGMPDHVHLLIRLPPNHHLPEVVRRIKGNSSQWVNQKWANRNRFGWQRGYGIFSVSESKKSEITRYIENQVAHHKNVPFRYEYRHILEKHGVAFDEAHL